MALEEEIAVAIDRDLPNQIGTALKRRLEAAENDKKRADLLETGRFAGHTLPPGRNPIGVKRHEEYPPVVGGARRSLERLTESHSDFPYLDPVDFHCIILTRGVLLEGYAAGRRP